MEEIALMLSLFAAGGTAGLFARFLPLSGWAALAFALIVPPAGVGLAMAFC
jgi:hypothetical protein